MGSASPLAIADTLKPDAREAVSEMKALGISPILLTGDNRLTAEAVAAEVGIDHVHAQVLPQDKAERVRSIQEQNGARVVMAGDGINDAPALMQADVGIAMGAGTDIAIESSDVIVMGNRVGAIMEARAIGGLSYRKTLQNLWLAFFFNGLGVPLATTGLVHPSWAMIAMALSVSLVLANSFGGRMFKRPSRVPEGTAPPAGERADSADAAVTEETIFSVPGIHCTGCVNGIRLYLKTADGVDKVEGDAKTKQIKVSYRAGDVTADQIREMIGRLGYEVS